MKIYYPLVVLFLINGSLLAQDESAVAIIVENPTDDSISSNETENSDQQLENKETQSDNEDLEGDTSSDASTDLNETEPIVEEPDPNQVIVKVEIPKQIEIGIESGFKLLTPWAPKPMQQAPKGWRYIPSDPNASYKVEVNLSTGKNLSLDVIPYTLVPELSNKVIQVREPGYQPVRGYQQIHSISAKIAETTANLKVAGDTLDQSIENLSTLVDSLPK